MIWGRCPTSFFVYEYPVITAPFIKETSLFPLNDLGTLVKNQLTTDVWVYFWTLNSIPLTYVTIRMPLLHYFDHSSFFSFETEKDECSNFIVLFQDHFGYLRPSYRSGSAFLLLEKNVKFWWYCIECVNRFADYCHLHNIKCSDLWPWMSLKISFQ